MDGFRPVASLQAFAEVPPSHPGVTAQSPPITVGRVILYLLGVGLNRGGGLLVFASTLLIVLMYRAFRLPSSNDLAPMIGVLTAATAGIVWLRWLGRRLEGLLPASRVLGDNREPLLYLRSFQSDNRIAGSRIPLAGYNGDVAGLETMDVALYEALREIGPPVAIGRPGEKLPPGGAERIYTDGWREEVVARAKRSRLIVILLSDTSACRWEIRAVVGAIGFERLLFVVPPPWTPRVNSVDHRVVWSELGDEFPQLPQIDHLTVAIGAPTGRLEAIRCVGWGHSDFPVHVRSTAIARAYRPWRTRPRGLRGLLRLTLWRISAANPLRILRAAKTAGARMASGALGRRTV